MAYSQKRPTGVRSKADKDGSAGGKGSDHSGGGAGGGGGGGRLEPPSAARPRGMSDASYMRGPSDMGGAVPRGYVRGTPAPEPLVGLSDLQEFGLPHGRSVKRVSDGSMVLPRMAEESSDHGHHIVPPPPPPPAMPLPRPPALGPKRAASVDNFSEHGRMSPVSVKRSSSPVPFKPLSPSPIVRTTPTPPRPFSVMSQSTDQDLMAIAELLSPTVDTSATDNDVPTSETAPMAELEPVPDVFFDEAVATTSIRDSMSSSTSSAYSSYHRPSTASVRSSIYTDSDGASYLGDDLPDPSVLFSLHSNAFHGGFHLPRGSLPMPPLDDNRSLSSATSYSSLRTPSLSRHSSVQFLSSPPVSPTSSYLPTPIDAPSPSPQPPSKSLDVIEEARYGEDQELRRVPSDDTQTIHMGTPSGSSFPPVEPFLMRKPEPRYPQQGVSTLQRRLPELEKLRISTQTADHATSPSPSSAARHSQNSASLPVPASPVLSARSSSSGASSHRGSGAGKSGFGKLFGRGDKDKDKESKKSGGSSVSGSNQSVMSFELGMSKAEEKRLKKEAARARTERLAQDLADKAKKRAEEAKAAKATRVKTKSSRPWEEEGGMYDGISYF
ncbi:hypothetical protein C8Q73DRAFT_82423 [Cubamyces lactineus]|nr:hypothetical protein C8Q73DRAFT_82423 [Cubamyces lactineus]